jgi:hypothetical protein
MALFNRRKSGRLSTVKKVEIAQSIQRENTDYMERMLDLKSAAMSPKEISHMKGQLSKKGFFVEKSSNLEIDELLFCHQFVARR